MPIKILFIFCISVLDLATLSYSDEDEKSIKVTFITKDEQNNAEKCPDAIDVDPTLYFKVQRDNSYHNSIIKYKRLDTKQDEEFTFNTGVDTDNTILEYKDGKLKCYKKNCDDCMGIQCNKLPKNKEVAAIIKEINLNPRDGDGKRTLGLINWSRNKYTLTGNYFTHVEKCEGKVLYDSD